ncbi:hypothetical protein C0J45_5240 [Silurus meridionalis]|nr:hypothetical protein C0J45_5240 [Silurus meridionalis]
MTRHVFLVLGFILIVTFYSDAAPVAVAPPTDCCFRFFIGKIPHHQVLRVKRTDMRCPQQGYVVTTPKFPNLCVREIIVKHKPAP